MPVYLPRTVRTRLATDSSLRTDFSVSTLDPDLLPQDFDEYEDSEANPSIASYGPSFPFGPDDTSVLAPVTDIEEEMHQNIRSLLLTSPGECIGDPNFGVGVINLLFYSENDQIIKSLLQDKIRQQMGLYYPAMNIDRLEIFEEGDTKRVALTVSLSLYSATIIV